VIWRRASILAIAGSGMVLAACTTGEITPGSAIRDFCDAKASGEQTRQTCVIELEAFFIDCRVAEKVRGIDFQDTNCVDRARDSWDHG